MTDKPHPFLPGVAVLTKKRSSPRWERDIVAKLLKTGRFTLGNEGRRQFSAREEWKDGNASHWEGTAVTEEYFSTSTVLLWTSELEAQKHAEFEKAIAADQRQYEARRLVEELRKVYPCHFDDARLAVLRRLVASFSKAPVAAP